MKKISIDAFKALLDLSDKEFVKCSAFMDNGRVFGNSQDSVILFDDANEMVYSIDRPNYAKSTDVPLISSGDYEFIQYLDIHIEDIEKFKSILVKLDNEGIINSLQLFNLRVSYRIYTLDEANAALEDLVNTNVVIEDSNEYNNLLTLIKTHCKK